MPQSRREQSRARREAKRKEKRKSMKPQLSAHSKRAILRAALAWPIMECWINEEWKDPKQLNQIVVARRNPATGEVVVGLYLVDRACLGVKNAHAANFINAESFRRELLAHLRQSQELIKIDFNLAAKIVEVGLEYGAQFGFRPHRDYEDASILLQDADPDAVDVEIPVGGPDGKPRFVSGPYDNVPKIMARLMHQLGPGGFTHVIGIDPDHGVFLNNAQMLDWGEDDGKDIVLTDDD
ncbi:MAG TPA: hypothetical protein PKZ84_22430 [Anaerolineae bacterium]|nr:hypothetical protein [Anaerolineae bacterium]HQI87254.1 hypothetical protein [Anaerolineae bacterium]